MRIHVLKPEEITKEVWDRLYDFECTFWSEGSYGHLTREYYYEVYLNHPECMFCATDEEGNIIGEFDILVPDKESIEKYFGSKEFMDVNNHGMQKGKNIVYLSTALLDEKYRGTRLMRILLCHMVKYLLKEEENGCFVETAYGEAVTKAGARMARGFGMEGMDIDEDGIGHYIAKDGLHSYLQKMKEEALAIENDIEL